MFAQQQPTRAKDHAYLSFDLLASRTFWAVAKLKCSGALSPDLTVKAAIELFALIVEILAPCSRNRIFVSSKMTQRVWGQNVGMVQPQLRGRGY